MPYDKIFWTEFIEIYKNLPALWKIKNKDYSDREKKNAAYNVLIAKLKEKDPTANRDMVVRKINSFRSLYRREVRKVKQSEKSDTDDLYVSRVWIYPLLSFLKEQEDCNESTPTMCEDFKISRPHQKKDTMSQEDHLIQMAVEILQSKNLKNDSTAQSWATQYEEMNDQQKILARKMISDILFQGCMGNIQMHHTVQLENAFNSPANFDYATAPVEVVTDRIKEQSPESDESLNECYFE